VKARGLAPARVKAHCFRTKTTAQQAPADPTGDYYLFYTNLLNTYY